MEKGNTRPWHAIHKAVEIENLSLTARKWAISLNDECGELQKRVKELESELEELGKANTHTEAQVYLGTVGNPLQTDKMEGRATYGGGTAGKKE